MTLYVDLKDKAKSSTLNFMTVLEALVDEMTRRIKFTAPKDLQITLKMDVKIPKYELNDKLKLLDILLLADQQITNCRIANTYNNSIKKAPFEYSLEIKGDGEPNIRVSGTSVTITISIKDSTRIHTFCDILCKANKLSKDPLVNGSRYEFTEYNNLSKAIWLYNCL
jgi:hypothetical protein